MNRTSNQTHSYPLWYFVNDSLMICVNSIGIVVAVIFILSVIRLDHPSYSVSNLIVCNTCLAMALTSIFMLINACYALKSDSQGFGNSDSFCVIRGTLLNLFYIYMYTSLCLKAFNRLRCIVYHAPRKFESYRSLVIIILLQWILTISLLLVLVFTDGIDYDWGSHLCFVPISKTYQFIYLMTIYYICIALTSIAYIYILYYVLHLPLLERYRRKRQLALLRRILVLLIMLLIPGLLSTCLLVYWMIYGTIPPYSFKISTLLESCGHTGAIITIFVSHMKLLRQYYNRKTPVNKKISKRIPFKNGESILLKEQRV